MSYDNRPPEIALTEAGDLLSQETTERADSAPAPLPLGRNFSWALFGVCASALSQFGIIVVFAKFGSPELVGQYALSLAIAVPIITLSNMQLRAYQAMDVAHRFRFGDYFGLRIGTIGLALLGIVAIACLGGYERQMALVIMAVAVSKAVEALSDVTYGQLQQCERMDRSGILQAIKGGISLATVLVALLFTTNLVLIFAAVAAARAAQFLVQDLPAASWAQGRASGSIRPHWGMRTFASIARSALPFSIVVAVISLNAAIPRYFLHHWQGSYQLGIYAGIEQFLLAGNLFLNAIGPAILPRLSRYCVDGRESEFRSLLLRLTAISSVLGILGVVSSILVGRPLLGAFFGPEYAARANILVYMAIALAIRFAFSFSLSAMRAKQLFVQQIPVAVASSIVCCLLSVLFIPRFGIEGAAWVVVASTAFDAVAYTTLAVYLLKASRSSLPSAEGVVGGLAE